MPGVVVTNCAVKEGSVNSDSVGQVENVVQEVFFKLHEDIVLGGIYFAVNIYEDIAMVFENFDSRLEVGGNLVSPVNKEGNGSTRHVK